MFNQMLYLVTLCHIKNLLGTSSESEQVSYSLSEHAQCVPGSGSDKNLRLACFDVTKSRDSESQLSYVV